MLLVEFLPASNDLVTLEVGELDGAPATGAAGHGAEHELKHGPLAEGVGDDLGDIRAGRASNTRSRMPDSTIAENSRFRPDPGTQAGEDLRWRMAASTTVAGTGAPAAKVGKPPFFTDGLHS
jgi:hypothetical protein